MIINDIKHIKTDTTRKDGRYPLRIGCKVDFFTEPEVGLPMILIYKEDNQGNPKDGYLRTSTVRDMYQTEEKLIITTRNSIYCFNKTE